MTADNFIKPYIESIDGLYFGQKWELSTGSNIIGRDPECEICLQERAISRQHARIFLVKGSFYIQDLESQNGTWLNQQRIQGARLLQSDDVINLAQAFSFRFFIPNAKLTNKPEKLRLVRIYVAAPDDIKNEKVIVNQVVDYLSHNALFRNKLHVTITSWGKADSESASLEKVSQKQGLQYITNPSNCDVFILLLWSRISEPESTNFKEQNKRPDILDGAFREAFEENKKRKKPHLLLYRRMEEPTIGLKDSFYREKIKQFELVENFFRKISEPDSSYSQGYHPYYDFEELQQKLEGHIRNSLHKILESDDDEKTNYIITPDINMWVGSPFPGLRAFTPSDHPIFFGRDRETNELISLIERRRFIALVGASGSGKSSLVGAGLIPRLLMGAIEGSRDWLWLRFTPGGMRGEPFKALAEAVLNLLPNATWDINELALRISTDFSAMDGIIEHVLVNKPKWAELLIFIDQFEELFTMVGDRERNAFIELLSLKLNRTRIIVTLRADFFHRCIDFPILTSLYRDATFPLSIPTPFMLLEMIKKPAERANLQFENGLPEKLVEEAGTEPGGLALMAYLLDELYERCKNDGKIRFEDYHALGGVRGAIGQRAEEVYLNLDDDVKSLLPILFRDLVEVDLRGIATRHRSPLANISPKALPLVEAFINARLLTSDVRESVPIVEVSHESLFENWERLCLWIRKSHEDLMLHRQLQEAVLEWEIKGRPEYLLWPEERLKIVYEMKSRLGVELGVNVLEFIKSESDRLLPHLERTETDHQNRSQIGERLSIIGDHRQGVGLRDDGLPDILWCEVPMGQVHVVAKENRFDLNDNRSSNTFVVTPESFYIAKYPVTYMQFQSFINSQSGINNKAWWIMMPESDRSLFQVKEQFSKLNSYPRENVNWFQANAFCKWLDTMLSSSNLKPDNSFEIRLPFEWEWQLVATGGISSRRYPWGEWDSMMANTSESGLSRTTSVGMYPHGAAPCGALDMSGNIWEWCLNDFDDIFEVDFGSIKHKSIRGGSFDDNKLYASTTHRDSYNPLGSGYFYGFRVVCAPSLSIAYQREKLLMYSHSGKNKT